MKECNRYIVTPGWEQASNLCTPGLLGDFCSIHHFFQIDSKHTFDFPDALAPLFADTVEKGRAYFAVTVV